MRVHIKKDKGDLAVAKVALDLTSKGYYVFNAMFSEHLPFDLVVYKNDKFLRIQVKYSSDGNVHHKHTWSSKFRSETRKYDMNDFDYYALYCPEIEKILYPSIKFGGCKIAFNPRYSAKKFYWWEDFLEFTDEATKKHYSDFGINLTELYRKRQLSEKVLAARFKSRKVLRPGKEELQKLLWEKPTVEISKDLGVSDTAIKKWAKEYSLNYPPRGYWNKVKAGKIKVGPVGHDPTT